MVGVANPVDYLGDLVHEDHDLLFQDVRGITKIADAAKAKDGLHFLSWRTMDMIYSK